MLETDEDFNNFFNKFKSTLEKLTTGELSNNLNLLIDNLKSNILSYKTNYPGGRSEILETFLNQLIETAYSNKKIQPSNLKNKDITTFEGDVIFAIFDLKNSSNDPKFKEKMANIFWIIDILEKSFKDAGLKLFATEGDNIYIGFFSNKLSNIQKIKLLTLIYLIFKEFGYNFNIAFDSFRKKKGEDLVTISDSMVATTVISSEFNKKVHNFTTLHKDGNVQYYISLKLLENFTNENPEIKKLIEENLYPLTLKPEALFNYSIIKKLISWGKLISIIFGNKNNEMVNLLKDFLFNNPEHFKINPKERLISSKEDLKKIQIK